MRKEIERRWRDTRGALSGPLECYEDREEIEPPSRGQPAQPLCVRRQDSDGREEGMLGSEYQKHWTGFREAIFSCERRRNKEGTGRWHSANAGWKVELLAPVVCVSSPSKRRLLKIERIPQI